MLFKIASEQKMLPANAVIIGKYHIIVDHRNWIKQLADPCDILTV
jgi:hypothetical protein